MAHKGLRLFGPFDAGKGRTGPGAFMFSQDEAGKHNDDGMAPGYAYPSDIYAPDPAGRKLPRFS
jgi:hypothetical protein